ncbi:YbaB/EbfC family nucleoid-associated protein [Nocardia blacklockiae]|uniref:YbaB/EbfC family nucleoid-associated protein n=1 Tax=Nocardia blacklockiae TaxID=480036 RepID=UPI0018938E60|nr:YbaB/EbfC family nucleoid-associated protein [Nocardia blacklockiae]MBF6174207.1 YbaB/EbfC family nucleoid-associated protein [Nocardia blacklockiae]
MTRAEDSGAEDSRAAQDELVRLVDALSDAFDERPPDLPGVAAELATARSTATSGDDLVTVTVDAYGVVTDIQLSSRAFQANSPERLAASVVAAARAAVLAAQRRQADIVRPLTETSGALPDLPDLYPGAPTLRGIRETVDPAENSETSRGDSEFRRGG